MKITIIGSGGVGGYFGARLARAGEDVSFVARGAHLAAIRENGLRVESATDGVWRIKARAFESLQGQPQADLVLCCVKSYDTQAAAELMRPVVGLGTMVLSLQNGIDNEDRLSAALGAGAVMGGVAYVFANIKAPGVIAHHQLGRIVFGEMDGRMSRRAQAVSAALERAGIDAAAVPHVRRTLWEKYIFLTALAGATTLTRKPVSHVREHPEARQLWERQVGELLALAAAAQVGLDGQVHERCVQLLNKLAPDNYSSLYHDLVQGKPLELEALHGHAVALGHRMGVPVPALQEVYSGLRPYAVLKRNDRTTARPTAALVAAELVTP